MERMTEGRDARWLLIGASGLVGRHLARALDGRDVVATAHTTPIPGAVSLDLRDAAAIARVVRDACADVIVVAAADAFVEHCEKEPAKTRAINVDAARRIADAAPYALLVVFSSEYVFDGTAGAYDEEDRVAPINEYGRQKVALETLARERASHLVCRVSG